MRNLKQGIKPVISVLFHGHEPALCNDTAVTIRSSVIRSCEPKDALFNGITYAVINAVLSMQLLHFASLSFLLRERFRCLCEILLLPEGELICEQRCASHSAPRRFTQRTIDLPMGDRQFTSSVAISGGRGLNHRYELKSRRY